MLRISEYVPDLTLVSIGRVGEGTVQTIFFFQRNGAFLQRSDNYFQKARKQQQFSEHWQLFSDPALRLLWSNPPYSGYVPTSDIPIPPTPPQNGFFNPGGPVPVLPRAC